MQYSLFFLSAIAATGALAAPATSSRKSKEAPPTGLRIDLQGSPAVQLNAANFDSDKELTHKFRNQGPFTKVTFTLGKQVKNQEVRCQLLDDQETPKPIIMTRGDNTDINFSMGSDIPPKPWTFTKESKVTTLKCSPNFKKTDQTTVDKITVKLSKSDEPDTVQTQDFSLTEFEEDQLPQTKAQTGASPNKKFDQVKLNVGLAIKNQALRCKVLDKEGKAIVVERGANIDETFADGLNPAGWTFPNGASEVSKIVCDPAFKKGDASDKVKPVAGASENTDVEEQDDLDVEPIAVAN